MKYLFSIFFILIGNILFSQQIILKKFETSLNTIEILTDGLDEILIENSKDNFITVLLDDENINKHDVITKEENQTLKINFQSKIVQKDEVFRKFITNRLNRVSVKIKIPKNKNITLLGTEIDIISKSYQGNFSIYIDKGSLNFNIIKGNLDLVLFSGNVFATSSRGKINIASSKGKIKINTRIEKTPFKKTLTNSERKLVIKSILANITLTTKKTQ